MEEEKSNAENVRDTIHGVFIFLVIGVATIIIFNMLSFGDKDDENTYYKPSYKPTTVDYKQWNEEYERYGDQDPHIDVSQQYGGR